MSSSPEELTLNGSTMEPQMAIDKEVLDRNKDDKVTHKDNRNLYLIKEGGMEIFFYKPWLHLFIFIILFLIYPLK